MGDEHDDWLTGIGVNVSTSAAPTVPLPPDDVLRRRSDGSMYWEPAPHATMGGAEPPASDDWVREFVTFYDLAPLPGGSNSSGGCLFNGEATTLDKVATTANSQAAIAGYKPNSNAKSIATKILANRAAGEKQGVDLSAKITTGDKTGVDVGVSDLDKLDMPALLDALEKLREARQLDRVALMKNKPRVAAAILAVKHQLDDDWKKLMGQISEADQRTIRQHVYGRIVAGDAGDEDAAAGTDAQDIVSGINDAIKRESNMRLYIGKFSKMDMRSLLGVLTALKKAGTLDGFLNYAADLPDRVGAAVLTVQQTFDGQWEGDVAKLNDDDRNAILEHAPADAKPKASRTADDKKKNAGWSTQFGGALQYAGHWTLQEAKKVKKLAPNNPPYDWTIQAQIGANYAGHPEDASGPEFQALVQFGYNPTTNQITVLAGLQGALVQTLWVKGVQVQIQQALQVLGGNVTDASAFNSISQQFQVQLGLQLLVKLGPVWVGLQGAGGVTYTQNSPIDFPLGASVVVQW